MYDDQCGFCRRWVPYWRKTLERRRFQIAPLQCPWVAERLGLAEDEVADDLRLLLADGSSVQGADVYRHVLKRIWWAFPIYLFAVTPGVRHLFDWAYRTFARNRYRVSRACGLPGRSS